MMAYLDINDDKRILVCDEDLRPFVSGAYQARYCFERCRRRAVKRAYRQRLRDRAATEKQSTLDSTPSQSLSKIELAAGEKGARSMGKRSNGGIDLSARHQAHP